ncbi:MAG: DUF2161 family putative PD-(D/E)XK-type phosphodiesterase [Planctomycetes bacterium]|nr:DUF2161 family putative PD-(D/E)XK-type phosphodiesterase [Planctomycetota bacterium]
MATRRPAFRETDLYPPVKAWLEANGYTVRGEVKDCDVAACRDGELVLIEMKRAITLDLILQVVRRQEADAAVYAAVPAPATVDRRWRELTRLLKRLEVGLILVYLTSALPRVEVHFHPVRQERCRRRRTTRALLSEMAGRSCDGNVGGSTRRTLMTAYREQALCTAAALAVLAPASPAALRAAGAPGKAGAILLANHYGWFERLAKGSYALTAAGHAALVAHRELVDTFRVSFNNTN